jgi:RimJ/RimL family protein N-acetyltransferase
MAGLGLSDYNAVFIGSVLSGSIMDKVIHFETPRLILRPFEDRDAVPFAAYRSDPEVARYQGWEAPYSLAQAEEFVSEMKARIPGAPGKWYQIAIESKADGILIGDCAFKRPDDEPRVAELGLTMARAYHRLGYGSEAMQVLLDDLFVSFDLHRVFANCDPQNAAPIRLLEKLGFRHEGCFRKSLWLKGEWVDEDWYAILDREWRGWKAGQR